MTGSSSRHASTWTLIRADWRANTGSARVRLALVGFRLAAASVRQPSRLLRLALLPLVALYKIGVGWILGMDIPPGTSIGPGLTIQHGYGLVIHHGCRIGAHCVLRQGVTLGVRRPGDPATATPRLGDHVSIGPNALLLGAITVGDGATIGAGAVVLGDVADGTVVVGNPARPLPRTEG